MFSRFICANRFYLLAFLCLFLTSLSVTATPTIIQKSPLDKREYGYIYGVNAYTLEDAKLGSALNQRAVGMIANKINLLFVPSDNVKITWTKIGNFELTEPFIVHFNEPGRFNAIKFDLNEKSIFFETIENQGTVTFASSINSVLVDGQSYSNFNESTLNTLEGKHSYKVTLVD